MVEDGSQHLDPTGSLLELAIDFFGPKMALAVARAI